MQFFPFMNPDSAFGAAMNAAPDYVASKAAARNGAFGAGRGAQSSPQLFSSLLSGEMDQGAKGADSGRQAVLGMWDKAQGGLSSFAKRGVLRGARSLSAMDERVAAAKGSVNLRALAARSGAGAVSGIKELSELQMTREDLLALKDGLRAYGLTRADVDALDERISSQAGMTWGQFMASLSEKMVSMGREFSPLALTEAQTRDLKSFFQKAGFTPAASDNLLSQLKAGKTATVWQAVSDKLAAMPEGATIELTSSELSTLGTVMKLSESGQARLMALFGGADSASLSAKQLTTVMSVLKAEVAADKEVDADSNQALRELVGQALTAAAERAGLSRQADGKPDNSERNQKILAEHNRRERAREEAGQAAPGDGDEEGHAARVLEADPNGRAERRGAPGRDALGRDGENGKASQTAKDGDGRADGKDAGTGKDGGNGRYLGGELRRHHAAAAEAEALGRADAEKSESEAAWKQMWDKIRVERTAATGADATRTSGTQLAAVNGPAERATQAASRIRADIGARALRQVESGILKNMGQGRTQLVLRLDPPELGKLNMVLSVKDGEVSATFRAETREAHHLISEQLSHLKSQLEQQGLKVGKMEVQTQLSGEQGGNQWLGAGNHNQAQEQENLARRSGLLRLLRGDAAKDSGLAREMQIEPRTARIARDGLDIIA